MASTDDDYATPLRLAIYLEIGWSDYLFGKPKVGEAGRRIADPDPLRDRVPPSFPIAVAERVASWIGGAPRSLCDVGGATGRLLFELDRRLPDLERLVLVEPSSHFCDWAARLLGDAAPLPEVPAIASAWQVDHLVPEDRPPPLRRAETRLSIVNAGLEDFRPESRFDLVTCLNVIDRHPAPETMLAKLADLLADDGLLVLSCPFDFLDQVAPDSAARIYDLNSLFAGDSAWSHAGETELFYEYRSHQRSWTRLSAQVVAKRRTSRPSTSPR